jgi:acylphosphatase
LPSHPIRTFVVRARVLVSGKVQGVFFRDGTRAEAQKRGVRGWVRNLRDGRVEAAFEGSSEAVDAMVAWCRVGPPLSRPTFVERKDEPEEGLAGFEIRPTV